MLANVWPQREPWPALEVPIIMKHTLAEHISVKHTPVHLSTQCSHNYETNTLNINVVQFHILCKCTICIAERWFLYDLVVVVVWPWESLRVHIWELISLEATPAPQRSRLQILIMKTKPDFRNGFFLTSHICTIVHSFYFPECCCPKFKIQNRG